MGEKPSLGLTLTEGSVSSLFQLVSSGDKEFTARMDVPPWRPHAPSSPHFKSMGPRELQTASGLPLGLCRPLPSSILKRQRPAGRLGAAVEVCVRVDLGCGGWSGLEQPLTGSRGAEAGERSEVRMTLLTPPCFLVELQEARHSKLRPTCPIIMAVCCHDRRTGTFCFTVCSCDLYILPN